MKYKWGIFESPWLKESPECWEGLFQNAPALKIKKNTILFHEGDAAGRVYLVIKGRFRISSYLEDGNEKQLYIAETGSIFGEQDSITEESHSVTAFAIVESEVGYLSADEFYNRLMKDVVAMKRVLEFETRKCRLLQRQVLALSYASATNRIARTLLDLYHTYGEDTPQGYFLRIHFTKNELAILVGTSRVTVSNELMKMEQSGLLIRRNNYYIITDLERLKELANS